MDDMEDLKFRNFTECICNGRSRLIATILIMLLSAGGNIFGEKPSVQEGTSAYGEIDVKDPRIQIPPSVYPLLDIYMRDTQVTRGRDGWFFMTGSVAAAGQPETSLWKWNDGIRVWKSRDLKTWEPLGLVWSLDQCDGWQRDFYVYPPDEAGYRLTPEEFREAELPRGAEVRRSAWAPEIHYLPLRDNYFLVGCMNHNMVRGDEFIGHGLRGATFVLRSTTGEPEGPYEDISPAAPLTAQIDANLFEDDDGKIYLVYQDGKIARLKDDLTGLAEEPRLLSQQRYPQEPYIEGTFLFKRNGKYILSNTIWSTPDPDRPGAFHYARPKPDVYSYDAVIASSDSIYGPYGVRTTSLIGGGHGNFFEDFEGQWWACIFWNPRGQFAHTWGHTCCPAVVPMTWAGEQMFPDFNAAAAFYDDRKGPDHPVSIIGHPADREIGEDGSLRNLQYFGVGDFKDIDLCGALLFELPVLPDGEVVTNAHLSFYVRVVGEPDFEVDLYGIGFADEAVVESSIYYAGDFLGDEKGHAGLQDGVLTSSHGTGVHTSGDVSAWLQSYYTANPDYSGGTYAVFRFNADVEAVSTNIRYEIGQANNAAPRRQPSLVLMTGLPGGGRPVR
jgi:hypothetical protein